MNTTDQLENLNQPSTRANLFFEAQICCRLCNGNLKTVLEFGETPLANSYPKTKDETEPLIPLTVVKCKDCGHVQLQETVNPHTLFDNYLYASSDSPSLRNHFAEYAKDIRARFSQKDYDYFQIMDIGCNDGILLREFHNLGYINLLGVEPAANIAAIAQKEIPMSKIYNEYFTQEVGKQIRESRGAMDVVTCNNVFAHVAELQSLVLGIRELMDEKSVFVFENAYLLDTIKGLYFDQVYHEHLQYYGIKPLVRFLGVNGMEIFDIKRVGTQGGSFRIYAQLKGGSQPISGNVAAFVNEEIGYGLYDDSTYQKFADNLQLLKRELTGLVRTLKQSNKTISCYGCPAKFALFSKFFELDANNIEYVVDDSPLKQGRFSPGKKIPIVGREHFVKNPTDFCIVSVWNMADAIIAKNKDYAGKFIVPMPEVRIV
jgi:hypothetical protein